MSAMKAAGPFACCTISDLFLAAMACMQDSMPVSRALQCLLSPTSGSGRTRSTGDRDHQDGVAHRSGAGMQVTGLNSGFPGATTMPAPACTAVHEA